MFGEEPGEIHYQARQSGQLLDERIQIRSSHSSVRAVIPNHPVDFCWQRTDKTTKNLDVTFQRTKVSHEDANADTLHSIKEDLIHLTLELESLLSALHRKAKLDQEFHKMG